MPSKKLERALAEIAIRGMEKTARAPAVTASMVRHPIHIRQIMTLQRTEHAELVEMPPDA